MEDLPPSGIRFPTPEADVMAIIHTGWYATQ